MTDFTPAYYQIKTDIKNKILAGVLHSGEMLPGRNKLAEQYECSWSTLNRSINELILEGILVAERGKGTYVSSRILNSPEKGTQSNHVKVWFCHPFPSVYSSLFEMMEGMREEAHSRGNSIQFLNTVNTGEQPHDLNGYIVVTPSNDQFEDLCMAWRNGEKFIVLNSSFHNAPFPIIDSDIYTSTKEAVNYLYSCNHKKIGLLGIRQGFSNYDKRMDAYKDAYLEKGLEYKDKWVVGRPENMLEAKAVYENWIDERHECTAVFAADYTTAMIVLEIIQQLNIKVPEDLSLIGIGDSPFTSALRVPLSTIVQPFQEMGKIAVSRVLENDWRQESLLIPCKVQLRDSISKLV